MSSKVSNARYADSYRMYPYEPAVKREMSLTQQVMVAAAIGIIIVLILF